MNYKEEYNKLITAVNELLQTNNTQLFSIVKAINTKDYLSAYEKLQEAITEIDQYEEKILNVKQVLNDLLQLGKPLPELQMNKSVRCSYTEPQEGSSCSTCINACKLTNEDMNYIVCNICNQAVKALQEGYTEEQIMDTFVVHPDGHCKQHIFTNNVPYIEDIQNPEEEIIIPPEAEGGFVDEDHMEPEPNNP